MEESPSFELPKASEKLAHKFIFDAMRIEIEETIAVAPPPGAPVLEEAEPIAVPLEPLGLPEGKKYFRVREVAQLTGVEPYVLRYWESEFPSVRPTKSRTGQRVYGRRDVEELHLIRHLLHVEKYSIKGARKKLLERRHHKASPADQVLRQRQHQVLKELQVQLRELQHLIRGNRGLPS